MTSEAVIELIDNYRFTYRTETEFQDTIAMLFSTQGWEFDREVRLNDRDRIDFLIGTTGVEVKVKGSWVATYRQLQRYAVSDRIEELVLVTTRLQHVRMVAEIGGKPLTVRWVGVNL